ncbi:MAG TPA: hypothetical protein VM325_08575 [Alphaproteobacteria bacterium]|nr:hypothetical protein [Alphaproteobacteria bacterium]
MLKTLMLVSGLVEVVFGLSALIVPAMVLETVAAAGGDTPTLALIRLLGAATLGLGVGALFARNHLDTAGGIAAAYGLGLYNVVGGFVLIIAAASAGGSGLWPGAILHTVIAALFVYAFLARGGKGG